MKKNEIDIAEILSWVFIILGIIFILWKVFGGSPTEFAIIVTFFIVIIFNLVSVNSKISRLQGQFTEFKKNSESKFNALASDFKEHIKHK